MPAIAEEKAALRRHMLGLRAALPAEQRRKAAEALAAKADLPAFRAFLPAPSGVIAGFMPIKGEINPLPLMKRLAGEGFRLALPRITPAGLVFHAYEIGQTLAPGQLGTREPFPDWPAAEPALILAALLAFDPRGIRVGYGKAYYDRAFAAHPRARRIGLAYAFQGVPHVPDEPHDVKLEAIFTEG